MEIKQPSKSKIKRLTIYAGYGDAGQEIINKIKSYCTSNNTSISSLAITAVIRFIDGK